MAAKEGRLEALLAEPAFAGPDVAEADDGEHHTAEAAKMAPAEPEPVSEPEPEPEPVAAAEPEPEPAKPFVIPDHWYAMDDPPAPDDGKPVWLMSHEGEVVEAVRRSTRYYDRNGGKWRPTQFWALRNCSGIPVAFEPQAWRPAL